MWTELLNDKLLEPHLPKFKGLESKKTILQSICKLQEQEDDDFCKKQVELRRFRLGADPLDILRKKVEAEMLVNSKVTPFIFTIYLTSLLMRFLD